MATENQQSDSENTGDNPNPEISTPTPVDGGIKNAESDHPTSSQPANTRSEAYQPTIIINVPEQQNGTDETANQIAREANDASWASFKVNICLFGLTLIVAGVSIWQGCMTQKSVKITFDALKYQIKKDSIDSVRTVRKDTTDSIADAAKLKRDTSFINKQKVGIDAQIATLQETQKQFAIGNEPYLQYSNNVSAFPNLKILVFSPVVFNYGRYPVIITTYNISLAFRKLTDDEFAVKSSKFTEENLVSTTNPWPISSDTIRGDNYTRSLRDTLFIRGEIFYKDLIKNRKKKYSFRIKYVSPDAQYFYGRKDEELK